MKNLASNAIDLALHRSKLENGLEDLTSLISRLRRLRKTAKEFHESRPAEKNAIRKMGCGQDVAVPARYELVATVRPRPLSRARAQD
jgi:hypothetical protein